MARVGAVKEEEEEEEAGWERLARRKGWGESLARCVGGRAVVEAMLGGV